MNAEPSTPYLRVDVGRLDANVARVGADAAAAGVALRPHAKTHKSPEIARRQLAAGARGLTVATIGEAEVFAEAGVTDLFVALPLWPDADRASRLRALAETVTLSLTVDSAAGAAHLATCLDGAPAHVLVEVDSGHHRSGAAPDEVGTVAAAAREAGLTVTGAFTFPGHSYAPQARSSAAYDERRALTQAADVLRATGVEPAVLSGGSTPSLGAALDRPAPLTELRPGVYVFGDAQQWELGATTPDRIALTCRATVISHAGGRVVLDAGSKALGADRAPYATGFGRLLDDPDARIVLLSEHHSVVETTRVYPLGTIVDVVPNHVCNAVNLAEVLYADHRRPGAPLDPWPVTARGRF
ncbi:alanine racemase [Nocardioides sp. DS6]|uniref:Alanine racemase n=1 Tax=Nocardioides eburneus TaxID=3231482 RepID=A0ABV3T6J7_9ACTN